jgi:hypothetical protein
MMEKESENSVYPFLFFIFGASAAMYGWRGTLAALAGYGFAGERSRTFAQRWVESTRQRLEEAQQRILDAADPDPLADFAGYEPNATRTVSPGGNRTRRPIPIKPRQPDEDRDVFVSDEWRKLLDDLFGAKRILQNVEDLTTEARHQGQESAVEETVGRSPNDIWKTEEDKGVCPTCEPLNGTPRSYWGRFFPLGPPTPHSRCRCHVEYESAKPVKVDQK